MIAAEYISTLDNLPSEVSHLLAEIRDRENKSQELLSHIQHKTSSYIRHSVTGQFSAKDTSTPPKVNLEYSKVQQLAEEKVALAQRIVELLTKACGRLEVDLARVLVASGEVPPAETVLGSGSLAGRTTSFDKINESLRNALGTPDVSPPHTLPSSGPMKRRRLNPPSGSSLAASPSPSVPTGRSRGRRASPRRGASMLDVDEDAEGEDEVDEGDENGDAEDNEIYCFCQKPSYGDMIGCDNPGCPYEWFHLSCVGITKPALEDSWFCPHCAPKMGAEITTSERRKGRRK